MTYCKDTIARLSTLPILAILGATWACSAAAEGQALKDADAIRAALTAQSAPPAIRFGGSILSAKPLTFHVSPDTFTRLCEPEPPRPVTTAGNAAPGAPGSVVERRNLYISTAPSVDLAVAFDFDQSTLRPEGRAQLDHLADAMKGESLNRERFAIAGHTDAQGAVSYNDKLSCDRALVARNYLREVHAIESSRMAVFGFGSTRLKDVSSPLSETNRRVEIRLIPAPSRP